MSNNANGSANPWTLDHVAVALTAVSQAWPLLREKLGGAWVTSEELDGFSMVQLGFERGRIELLEPRPSPRTDFLDRFLTRHGPGVHHITFKVPDIAAALDYVVGVGVKPVIVNLDDPTWREAFFHPADMHGIVVQLAQPGPETIERPAPPAGFPDTRAPQARFERVVHTVRDLPGAVRTFTEVLRGVPTGQGETSGSWCDMEWPTGPALRLVQASAGDALGSRPGACRALEFRSERHGGIGATLGTEVRVLPTSTTAP